MSFEGAPKNEKIKAAAIPEEPGLEIVPTDKQPNITRVPPSDVAEKIIGQIDKDIEEDKKHEEDVKRIRDLPTFQ